VKRILRRFRRDLRLADSTGLCEAARLAFLLQSGTVLANKRHEPHARLRDLRVFQAVKR
jgi:hypothetical protein